MTVASRQTTRPLLHSCTLATAAAGVIAVLTNSHNAVVDTLLINTVLDMHIDYLEQSNSLRFRGHG